MLPQWISARAAQDLMDRSHEGVTKKPSSPLSSGVLSLLGVTLIAFGTFATAAEHLGTVASAMLGLVAGVLAFLAAYRTRGHLGVVVGGSFAVTAAYALHRISAGSGGASWFWDIVVFVVVGLDQWAYRSR